jgi:hypothetical protein
LCSIDEDAVETSKHRRRPLVGPSVQAIKEREFDKLELLERVIEESTQTKVYIASVFCPRRVGSI